ncbi:hypothetical protein [Arthrobacter mangrovi]|nr:hypothetical protein [Arthrobacter mangrovi]
MTLSRFGGRWVLRKRTGQQFIASELEAVAGHIARTGAVDWEQLQAAAEITVEPYAAGPWRTSPYDAGFKQILDTPPQRADPTLDARQFTVALLVHASNALAA